MFWKLRKSSITIPAELHEKLARTCQPIQQVDSEVICVRTFPSDMTDHFDAAEAADEALPMHEDAEDTNLSDVIGYETHWQWYR